MRVSGSSQTNSTLIGKTGLFFLMISVIVLFGSLSLAFIVTPERIDQPFYVPPIFFYNSLFLIISSALLHYGWNHRADGRATQWIQYALVVGVLFLIGQGIGWYQLVEDGITLQVKNPKMHYLYLLSGVHALHLIGGLTFIAYVLQGYQGKAQKYFEMAVFFWHFLGVLWIYLLAVLLINS